MTCDPEHLASQLRAGDSDAWAALYDAYSASVWRSVARRVGPQASDVADIVQETFLAAARAARMYDPSRASPWAWLSGIARRQAALHFRRRQTRPIGTSRPASGSSGEGQSVQTGNWTDWLDGRASEPADMVMAAETATAVREALSGLPVEYETLLVGKYIDGLPLAELAASEGLSLDAANSKLARARRAFRDAFLRLEAHQESTVVRTKP